MILSIITTAASISIILNIMLILINRKTKAELSDLNKSMDIHPGDRVIIPNFLLRSESEDRIFRVTYEANVIDLSVTKIKVSATSFDWEYSPNINQSDIISFMQNKWLDRSHVEVIIDGNRRRDGKLARLLRK